MDELVEKCARALCWRMNGAQEACVLACRNAGKCVGQIECLSSEIKDVRLVIPLVAEECARIAEEVRDGFLSEEYAYPQPLGSIQERFACNQVIESIRQRLGAPDER